MENDKQAHKNFL